MLTHAEYDWSAYSDAIALELAQSAGEELLCAFVDDARKDTRLYAARALEEKRRIAARASVQSCRDLVCSMAVMPRSVVALVAAIPLLAMSVVACETSSVPADTPDAALVFCKVDTDCPSGTRCTYPIDVGCMALGECRDMTPPADTSNCDLGGPVCACSGMTITVPPCWNSLSPVPASGEGACDAGVTGDANLPRDAGSQ